jgi:hypothetical protein
MIGRGSYCQSFCTIAAGQEVLRDNAFSLDTNIPKYLCRNGWECGMHLESITTKTSSTIYNSYNAHHQSWALIIAARVGHRIYQVYGGWPSPRRAWSWSVTMTGGPNGWQGWPRVIAMITLDIANNWDLLVQSSHLSTDLNAHSVAQKKKEEYITEVYYK